MGKTLKAAFVRTVPVLCGYLFVGIAFGMMLRDAGYGWGWALGISLVVYAGSMQFVLISFLTGSMGAASMAVVTFLLNSRHMFYGLSFLERFRSMGKAYPYMVFSLTDETYSLLCAEAAREAAGAEPAIAEGREETSERDGGAADAGKQSCAGAGERGEENRRGEDRGEGETNRRMIGIAALNHVYWVAGSVLGSVLGGVLPLDTTGIDFAMTALFVVLFVEQWRASRSHVPALAGAVSAAAFRALLGPERFMLPALAAAVLALSVWSVRRENGGRVK